MSSRLPQTKRPLTAVMITKLADISQEENVAAAMDFTQGLEEFERKHDCET